MSGTQDHADFRRQLQTVHRRASNKGNQPALYGYETLFDIFYDAYQLPETHWLRGVTVSEDDASKWAYTDASGKRVKTSVTKLLGRIERECRGMPRWGWVGTRLTERAEAMATCWGEHAALLNAAYTFEEIQGQEIVEAYRNGPSSCMSGASSGDTQLYANNPGSVGLIKIMLGEEYVGRALVWTDTGGVRLLDRVYPSDGGAHVIKVRTGHKLRAGWSGPVPRLHCETMSLDRKPVPFLPWLA